jgi:hypothetical protein
LAGVTLTSEIVTGLTPGLTYKFVVQARNIVGLSAISNQIEVLAAQIPNAPINVAEVVGKTTGYQVGLSWSDGSYDGASPVIDYQVLFAESSAEFTIYASNLLARETIVSGLTPGLTYKFSIKSRNLVGYSAQSAATNAVAA